MRDRIRPPKDLEEILDNLKEDKVFETKQKGMMFAAAVGFCLFRDKFNSSALDGVGEGIKIDFFERPDDVGFIDALAVTTKSDLGVVSDHCQPERVEIFERYALLGLKEIKRACYNEKPEYPIFGILKLLDLMDAPKSSELPGLDGLL